MTLVDSVDFAAVQDAADRLKGIAHRTPIFTSRSLNQATGLEIVLKCENFQRGGAFKFRGAYNTISRLEGCRSVVAFSSGNHAQGVALAAQLLGVQATICMPSDAPAVKVEGTRAYGAEVVFYDRMTEDRDEVAGRVAQQRGAPIVPPFNHPHIVAGAGTAALELIQDVPDLDALVTPVGGGGLISGSALAAHGLRPDMPVLGVEPADGNDVALSLAAGHPVQIPPPRTIADGLRTQMPGDITFPIIQSHVAQVLTVTDDEIRTALRFLLLRMKLVVEPSSAVVVAAAMAGKLPAGPRRVGMIITGGNIDPEVLSSLWA
ncbi:pyridoxal-phosphate dependent enzyme [Chloroflexia bacterium SDU3-3]|nr:pyridoxal-phosphate dependent enzyme [Chloroflexia bacterium SDU3-3]